MRLAWFRDASLEGASPLDETAAAIRLLGQTHEIDVVTVDLAHDFVWKQFRAPYDMTLFEVGPHFAGSFMRPYTFHYPGVPIVSSAIPRTARGAWLAEQACANARLVIVRNAALASGLQHEHPSVPVRWVPLGLDPSGVRPRYGSWTDAGPIAVRPPSGPRIQVALVAAGRSHAVARAVQRARDAGDDVTLGDDPATADVVLALAWPGSGESLMPAIAAMAARQPVVVFETESTAEWPALDPQTWRPRPPSPDPPIAISIDPRDEEHSLTLAIRRLAGDARLRDALAAAGQAWWQSHATLEKAVFAWRAALEEAVAIPVPAAPAWLPDGTQRTKEILGMLGVGVDFL